MNDQIDLLAAFDRENGITSTHTMGGELPQPAPAAPLPSPESEIQLPPIRSAMEYLKNNPVAPDELIKGLLHQGSKLVLGGSSKSYKTWSLLDLGVSVACGKPWWGMETVQKRVLYLNFEIQDAFFWSRLRRVCEAKELDIPDNFDIWGLRGFSADIDKLLPKIIAKTEDGNYGLIILDPIYKVMGNRDENSASDIGRLLSPLDKLAGKTGSAIVFGAHFAKGNASNKESIDRISGSGVFARDPDSILTLTKHETEECFSVQATLRNFPPMPSFVLKWEMPLMTATTFDPKRLKSAGGAPKSHQPEDLLGYLWKAMTTTEWKDEVTRETGMSEKTFYNLKKELMAAKKIDLVKEDKTWMAVVAPAETATLLKEKDIAVAGGETAS